MNPIHSGTFRPALYIVIPCISSPVSTTSLSSSFDSNRSQFLCNFIRFKAMFLRSVSSFSVQTKSGNDLVSSRRGSPAFPSSSALSFQQRKHGRSLGVSAAIETSNNALTGVVFQPFEEVKKDELDVPVAPYVSLARQRYADDCESAINEQINVEYNVSYVYHSLYAYFDRDNIALRGLAKFFKESSEEEREHAEKLMEYQNIRGGRVKLHSILLPPSEFEHAEKGDALYAMELALSLEKLTNEKLLNLHNVAAEKNDPQMAEFIEREFLSEQVEAIKKIAEYVTQLRMVGKGHGVWHFDQKLLHEDGALH